MIEKISPKGEQKTGWLKDALFRKLNKKWLDYSSQIARRILARIDEKGVSQAELAKLLNVSPQQISKIVKGKENLTLETISKISDAIDFELITFPEYRFSHGYSVDEFYKAQEVVVLFSNSYLQPTELFGYTGLQFESERSFTECSFRGRHSRPIWEKVFDGNRCENNLKS